MTFQNRFFITTITVFCAACGHEKKEAEKPVFAVTSPARQDVDILQRYVAQVRAIQHIELRALERGYLQKTFVDEGQPVKKGQLMFQVVPRLYQAELQKAQAETDFAQIEFDNTRSLAERKIVSPNELALERAKLEKAKAEQSLAKVHRDFTEVRAPFDGIMGRFQVRLGSLLSEGDLLTTLSDNSQMWVYFNMAEAEYLDYRAHVQGGSELTVKLQLANGKVFAHEGKIETIEADFNSETGTIAFRAAFPNPEKLLRHGETGTILMSHPLPKALVIAQKSTFEVMDKRFVYVVDAQRVAHARQISVAEELPHLFVINGGLSEDDQVVLEGISRLRDGETVATRFVSPGEALARLDVPAQ